jgi:hypothetical protein
MLNEVKSKHTNEETEEKRTNRDKNSHQGLIQLEKKEKTIIEKLQKHN